MIRTFADYKRKTAISPLMANNDRGTLIRNNFMDYGQTSHTDQILRLLNTEFPGSLERACKIRKHESFRVRQNLRPAHPKMDFFLKRNLTNSKNLIRWRLCA